MSDRRHGVFTRVFPSTGRRPSMSWRSLARSLWCSACSHSWQPRRAQGPGAHRLMAERIAVANAGKMASHSQEDGDRFSLKESNSIKSLIAEAVLALNAGNTKPARRAIAKLKAEDIAPASAIFAETGAHQTRRGRACGARGRVRASPSRRAGAARRPAGGAAIIPAGVRPRSRQSGEFPGARARPVPPRRYSERRGLDREARGGVARRAARTSPR